MKKCLLIVVPIAICVACTFVVANQVAKNDGVVHSEYLDDGSLLELIEKPGYSATRLTGPINFTLDTVCTSSFHHATVSRSAGDPVFGEGIVDCIPSASANNCRAIDTRFLVWEIRGGHKVLIFTGTWHPSSVPECGAKTDIVSLTTAPPVGRTYIYEWMGQWHDDFTSIWDLTLNVTGP